MATKTNRPLTAAPQQDNEAPTAAPVAVDSQHIALAIAEALARLRCPPVEPLPDCAVEQIRQEWLTLSDGRMQLQALSSQFLNWLKSNPQPEFDFKPRIIDRKDNCR